MAFFSRFFAWHVDPGLLLYGTYNRWLVALSVAVAVFASGMALHAAYQARNLTRPRQRHLTLLAGSLSLGFGVWGMHFIGMLAFQLCTPVSYNLPVTLLSVVPSLAASWVALHLLSQASASPRQLWLSGSLVGAGIGAMHYTGMAAMDMAATLRYDPWMFGLSLLVAMGLAVLALWVRFELTRIALSGLVMGLAIAGMHYTGMAAARFIGPTQGSSPATLHDPVPLALTITLVTVIVSALIAASNGLRHYRQIVRQLRAQEARMRAIADTSMDGIIVFDEQGIVHEYNCGAQRIYGWTAAEMVGHSVTVIMIEPFRSQAERDFMAFLGAPDRLLHTEVETLGVNRDGRHIPIRLVIGRMPRLDRQLYVAYVSDISEQQAMQTALRDSEAQFRSLIANIPGISYRCRMERGWPMVYISDAVEAITGYPAQDFLGANPTRHFADLVSKQDIAQVACLVEAAEHEGRSFVLEFQLRRRDGTLRWMWGNGSLVRREDGTVQWVDGVLLDITERHTMEAALRQAKEDAEAAAMARSTFLANMSHEIRTPMNAILGFTEVVLAGELPPGPRKHLETVHKSARSLLHLLNDILDTSKLERGAVELETLDFSVTELVQQLCTEQSIQARRKGLLLRTDIQAGAGTSVRGDPHRLRQVLLNLLGNAIKFTTLGQVTLHVHREGQDLHFEVRDTGIGIAPERLPHVFEAFTQADASMSRRFGGTGLGTTISKQLVELMHGRIWVESTPGQGSVFHVQVPLPLAIDSAPPPAPPPVHPTHLPTLRVLAVDDVTQNIELLRVLLEGQGHTVLIARHGQEALDLLAQQAVDLILMDVHMPVMDGLSACRTIRQLEQLQGRPRTPIIALSASVQAENREAAMAAGMDGFASKPLDLRRLLAEIARVTGTPMPLAPDTAPTQALSRAILPPAPPPQTAAIAPAPSPQDLDTWQHQADRLRVAFQRGERLDNLLQQFCQTIGPQVAAHLVLALEQAVDDFDFEAAQACLDQLIQSLPLHGVMHAPL